MQSEAQDKDHSTQPSLVKECVVGIVVGSLFGPLVGWFVGTFATFFLSAALDANNLRGIRTSAFVGGLIGIPLGVATGTAVSLPLRALASRVLPVLKDPWLACCAGALAGCLCGYVIDRNWDASLGGLIYVLVVCTMVGAASGAVVVLAKPKWL